MKLHLSNEGSAGRAAATRPPLRWQTFGVGIAFMGLAGCGAATREMNVVVFNYGSRALADVYVDGQPVGAGYGAFGTGGTGGSISCCHPVNLGTVKIRWVLGGPSTDPKTGTSMSAAANLQAFKTDARYLAVYLYEDGTAALDTAKGIPDDRYPQERPPK